MPSAEPPRAGLTTTGWPSDSSSSGSDASRPRSRSASLETVTNGRRRQARRREQALGQRLVERDRGARPGPSRCRARSNASSSPWAAPSSPPAPCTATITAAEIAPREPRSELAVEIERHRLVPEPPQRTLDARARAQRDRALERPAAAQHPDVHAGRGACVRGASSARGELERLAADGAEAPRALAQRVLVDRREVQPQRAGALPVEVGGAPGHEGDLAREAAHEQVVRVEAARQRRPQEEPALRASSSSSPPAARSRARRRAHRGGRGRYRAARRAARSSAGRRGTRRRGAARASSCTGRPPACTG